ncbi:hypothetical protein JHK87_052306 [Glycine soja]|nr:hypothetical protein JHK87_052306 [Glycine soja]
MALVSFFYELEMSGISSVLLSVLDGNSSNNDEPTNIQTVQPDKQKDVPQKCRFHGCKQEVSNHVKFLGEIPQCFSHITTLSYMKFPRESLLYGKSGYIDDSSTLYFVDVTMLAWKGQNREYGKNFGLMKFIDLSGNHLTGEIPHSLAKLVALVGLNLSRNNLTGLIPSNIGHMKMLESLDLSRNHLYVGMPTSFSNLSFLSYMKLSFNNLS